MSFVHPLLLAGAAAAIVPIILHLVMRQKPRQVEFPALRLLRARRQSNTRRLRLRHLLLLLLRAGAVVLVALALARPSLNVSGLGVDQEAPVAAALVFDTGPRMQYLHENRTRLAAAQELALWLLGEFPPGSQVAVLESSLAGAAFQLDLAAARDRIQRLAPANQGASLGELIDEARRLLAESAIPRREIYVFSDLAQGAWQSAAGNTAERIAALEGLGVYVVDVGLAEPVNTSLGSLRLSAQTLAQTSPLEITTQLSQVGPGGAFTVQLWLGDEGRAGQKRSEVSVELGAGQSREVSFSGIRPPSGLQQGFLRVVGSDGLEIDNTRYFTVEVAPVWRILIAAPEPVAQYAFFLAEALAPAEFRKTGQARFACELVPLDELDAERRDDVAAVFVLDPTPLDDAHWRRLARFAESGGGVAICLGDNAGNPGQFHSPAAAEVMPARLESQARHPEGDLALGSARAEHPLGARFATLSAAPPWDAFPVYRYWQLVDPAPDALTVMPYSNGDPAVVERPLGRGRVVVVTTPFSEAPGQPPWNRLPTGIDAWPFVMLANELALYLAGAGDNTLNYSLGQAIALRPQTSEPITAYVMTTPSGEAQKRTADPRQGGLTLPGPAEPGNYRLRAGGQQATLDTGFSVNLAPEATDLARLTPQDLAATLGPAARVARNREEIARDVGLARVGREIYPWLAALLAVVLALEYILSNRFYREPDEAAPAAAQPAAASARGPLSPSSAA